MRASFTIAADHPCLAGHFPGNPIVPGVILLDRLIEAVENDSGRRVAAIPRCKFVGPLRPDQPCRIEWQPQGDALRFVCSSTEGELARGVVKFADG